MKNVKKLALAGAGLGMTALANAQTAATDYGTELTENLSTINSIWGTVATIMIGSALVAVGVRFFRKTK